MTHAWGRQPVAARLKDVGSGAEDKSVGKFGAHSKDEHQSASNRLIACGCTS